MLVVSGYQIKAQLYESSRTRILKAIRLKDHTHVVLKMPNNVYPDLDEIREIKHEYRILSKLKKISGVIQANELKKNKESWLIELEDTDSYSLAQLINQGRLPIKEFLSIAIKLIKVLKRIHKKGVIHKDLNPSNILWNPSKKEIKIIDFDIASAINNELIDVKNAHRLIGSLNYLSPEQTGRIRCTIDYRTDFYSLGVTFYQLITGQLPFQSNDTLEIIHQHIAKVAMPPHFLDTTIPEMISTIIMKLMAKRPEERYQTEEAIIRDLERCLSELQNTNEIPLFELAKSDTARKLNISQKIYGREDELAKLTEIFQKTAKGKGGLTEVFGRSGIGKSALIHEFHQIVLPAHGYFIEGNFDQYNNEYSHLALSRSIRSLAKQIASEGEDKIAMWRKELTEALGQNGQLLIDIAPELKWIIGEQEQLVPLSGAAAENRFLYVISQFFQAIGTREHPIIIFWDDMQWSDNISIKILERWLFSSELKYVHLILSYRDEQRDAITPLRLLLDRLPESLVHTKISLQPLSIDSTANLLADSLRLPLEKITALAQICHDKTLGNPLYLNEFLRILNDREFIFYNLEAMQWQIDLSSIQKEALQSSTAEIILGRIKKLPNEIKSYLSAAACIGIEFDLRVLASLVRQPEIKVARILNMILKENYIVPLNENCLYAPEVANSGAKYRFSHDKIFESAYCLLNSQEHARNHYAIAQILSSYGQDQNVGYGIQEIVQQFDQGLEFITAGERIKVIAMNLQASILAESSMAYEQAIYFLEKGIGLTNPNDWDEEYHLSLKLHSRAAHLHAILAQKKLFIALSNKVLKHAKNLLDTIPIHRTHILFLIANRKPAEAVKYGLNILRQLGYHLPFEPKKPDLLKTMFKANFASLRFPIKSLPDLPKMADPNYLAIIDIIIDILASCAQVNQKLLGLVGGRLFYLTLKYGISEGAPMGLVGFSIIKAGIFKKYESAYQYATAGLAIAEKFKLVRSLPHSLLLFGGFVNHTRRHYSENLRLLEKCHQESINSGNVEFAAFSAFILTMQKFYMGKNLGRISRDMEKAFKYAEQLKQEFQIRYILLHHQAIKKLRQKNSIEISLSDESYDEFKQLKEFRAQHDLIGLNFIYFLKLMLAYLFRNYDEAIKFANEIRKPMKNMLSHILVPVFIFYDTLAQIAIYPKATLKQKTYLYFSIRRNLKKMHRFAKNSPRNYAAKYYLISAQWANVRSNYISAVHFYDKAISLAHENDLLQEEALAKELTGLFYEDHHQDKIANLYLKDAYMSYKLWGCYAKMYQLEQEYPWLAQRKAGPLLYGSQIENTFETSYENKTLDYISVLKASMAVANEIKLPNLIKQLLTILTENSAAQRSVLLIKKTGNLYVEGEFEAQAGLLQLLKSFPIENYSDKIPLSVIQYVSTSMQILLLEDAFTNPQFIRDDYIVKENVRSILCLPLIYQGKLVGILYFEHKLIPSAFTKERLDFIKVMSSQIVVSLQNALLHRSFEKFVPMKFIELLGKHNPSEINLGDSVQKNMSVLFADIRGFTTITEKENVADLFALLNEFLGCMEPIITSNNGFIDKYIGDAIMALFSQSPIDAINAAIQMQIQMQVFRNKVNENINVGIGISTGLSMLGTLGSQKRMDGTIISDTVNMASRIESLNKIYGTSILISDESRVQLPAAHSLKMRHIDKVILKGKTKPTIIWEILNHLPEKTREIRLMNSKLFEQAVAAYQNKEYALAKTIFMKCLANDPDDTVAAVLLKKCAISLSNLDF